MTAADRREELEAAIWREVPGIETGRAAADVLAAVDGILAAADKHAEAVAAERIAAVTCAQLASPAEIRRRGEEAAAEYLPARAGHRTRRSTP